MEIKFKNLCIIIICMLFSALSLIYMGIAKSHDIAVDLILSSSNGGDISEATWSTLREFSSAMMWVLIAAGCFLLILSLVFAIISFIKFVKIK